jgi:hypothetical protein
MSIKSGKIKRKLGRGERCLTKLKHMSTRKVKKEHKHKVGIKRRSGLHHNDGIDGNDSKRNEIQSA